MSSRRPDELADPARRRVLSGLAATLGASTVAACTASSPAEFGKGGIAPAPKPPAGKSLPNPADSGIEHIVVVMMENRSFDHMLGWVPGSDGRQAGQSFVHAKGNVVSTFPLATAEGYGFGGCNWADPDHGYDGGRIQFNNGRMDGWLRTGGTQDNADDHFPVGYFTADDLPFFKGVADNWTVCDRYFCGILSSTYPNRFYMHSGETDRLSNTMDISSLPTIWDRLAAKGISGNYFYSDLPLLGLWGATYVANGTALPNASFFAMAAAGQLPAVSYVEPRFLGEGNQVTNDDHPSADVRDGQVFLNQVYQALRDSPNWDKTLLIINYDEWGGFYDHVAPPLAPISEAERALGNDGRLGFRVPLVMIGPHAPKAVSSLQFDPQSILNFITWRFGLDAIGPRADWSLNLAWALDFANARADVKPSFDTGNGPYGMLCGTPLDPVLGALPAPASSAIAKAMAAPNPSETHFAEWLMLRDLARRHGFAV